MNRSAGASETPSGGWIGAHLEYEGAPAIAILPESLAEALNRATPPITLDAVREAWVENGTIPMDRNEPRKLPRVWMGKSRPRCYIFAQHVLDGEQVPDGMDATTTDTQPQQQSEPEPWFEQGELGAGGWPLGSNTRLRTCSGMTTKVNC